MFLALSHATVSANLQDLNSSVEKRTLLLTGSVVSLTTFKLTVPA